MKLLPKSTLLTLGICLFLLSTPSHAAKFYKWTDENGNIHFGDKAPDKSDAESVHINSRAPKPSGKAPAKFGQDDVDEAKEKQAKAEKDAKEAARRKTQCDAIRNNMRTLNSGVRVAELDDSGERRFIDDDERASRVKETQAKLDKFCAE